MRRRSGRVVAPPLLIALVLRDLSMGFLHSPASLSMEDGNSSFSPSGCSAPRSPPVRNSAVLRCRGRSRTGEQHATPGTLRLLQVDLGGGHRPRARRADPRKRRTGSLPPRPVVGWDGVARVADRVRVIGVQRMVIGVTVIGVTVIGVTTPEVRRRTTARTTRSTARTTRSTAATSRWPPARASGWSSWRTLRHVCSWTEYGYCMHQRSTP
jgi:hypothetical protein